MLKLKTVVIYLLIALVFPGVFLYAEETLTLTTYYPAPFGVYKELRAKRMAVGDSLVNLGNDFCWEPDSCIYQAAATADLLVEGNIGIGVLDPLAKVVIKGAGNNSTSYGLGVSNSADNYSLVVRDDGNVGIGTINPASKLYIGYTPNQHNRVSIDADTNLSGNIDFLQNGTRLFTLGMYQNRLFIDEAGQGSVVTITGGKAGVGLSSPDAKLTVQQNTASDIFNLYDGSVNVFTVIDGGSVGVGMTSPDGKVAIRQDAASDIFNLYDGSANVFTVIDGGNVGIGANPTRGKLQVSGGSAFLYVCDNTGASTFNDLVYLGTGTANIELYGNAGKDGGGYSRTKSIFYDADNHYFRQSSAVSPSYMAIINGDIGINDNTPSYKLDVNGTIRGFGITDSSDIRWKKNVTALDEPLDKIVRLRGVSHEWNQQDYPDKDFAAGPQIGIIAQELEVEYPELVDVDNEGYKSIQYGKFTAVLLEAIKELKAEKDAEIRALEARIRNLENR